MMKPVSPVIFGLEDEEIVIAKDSPDYSPLTVLPVDDGYYVSRWELSDEDIENIKKTRSIYLFQYHCNKPLTPVSIQTEHPIPQEQEIIDARQN